MAMSHAERTTRIILALVEGPHSADQLVDKLDGINKQALRRIIIGIRAAGLDIDSRPGRGSVYVLTDAARAKLVGNVERVIVVQSTGADQGAD